MTADVRHETTLRCDAPKCRNFFHLPCDFTYTRMRAALAGWVYTPMPYYRDLCPEHAKEGEG